MLDQYINEYNEIQKQKKELEEKLSSLKEKIVEEMNNANIDSFTTDDGIKATLVSKETFKYVDETRIISYLKSNGLESYLSETINTTMLNKELRKGLSLNESLSGAFVPNCSQALTVKEN